VVTASHLNNSSEKAEPSQEMLALAQAIAAAVVESLQKAAAKGALPDDLKNLLHSTPGRGTDRLAKPRPDSASTPSGRSLQLIDDDDLTLLTGPAGNGHAVEAPLPAAVAPMLRQSSIQTGFIPNYELINKIDEDETCERFLARDLIRHVNVVVHLASKYLNDQPAFLERMARALNGFIDLEHPSLVKVYERGFHQGLPFYVTETVPGKTLADIFGLSGPMSETDVLRMCIQLAEGLQHVHNKLQLTHGELRLSSIIVAYSGLAGVQAMSESESIKVTDFFRVPTPWHDPARVSSMASPVYVAPERLNNIGGPDVRSDIYSIGAIMYHLMVGAPPFTGTPDEVRNGHLKKALPDIAQIMPGMTPFTRDLLHTALAKDLKDRFLSYQGFIVACQKALKALAALDSSSMRILRKPMTKATGTGRIRSGSRDTSSDLNRAISVPTPKTPLPEAKAAPEIGSESRLIQIIASGVAKAYSGTNAKPTLAEAGRLHEVSTRIVRKYLAEKKSRDEAAQSSGNTTALVRKIDSLLRKQDGETDAPPQIGEEGKGVKSLHELSTRILRRHLRQRAAERTDASSASNESIALVRRRVNLRSITASKERPRGARKMSWGHRTRTPFSVQIDLPNILYIVGVIVFTSFIGIWLIKALFTVFMMFKQP
jgi:serine/threonine protein kinase